MAKKEITLFTKHSAKGDAVQIPEKGYVRIETTVPRNGNCHGMRFNEKRTSGVGFSITPSTPLSAKPGEWLVLRDSKNMERIYLEVR